MKEGNMKEGNMKEDLFVRRSWKHFKILQTCLLI